MGTLTSTRRSPFGRPNESSPIVVTSLSGHQAFWLYFQEYDEGKYPPRWKMEDDNRLWTSNDAVA